MHTVLSERGFFGGNGRLQHYYHFMIELVWPLYVWLRDSEILNDGSSIYFPDHNASYFKKILEELFDHDFQFPDEPDPKYFDVEPPELIDKHHLRGDLVTLGTVLEKIERQTKSPTCGARLSAFYEDTVSDSTTFDLRDYVLQRLAISPPDDVPILIVIQRENREDFEEEKEKKFRGQGVFDTRGRERRGADYGRLVELLQEKLGDKAKVSLLKLAVMPFRDQVEAFHQATAVVGDHGAGLANCIWMRDRLDVWECFDVSMNGSEELKELLNSRLTFMASFLTDLADHVSWKLRILSEANWPEKLATEIEQTLLEKVTRN